MLISSELVSQALTTYSYLGYQFIDVPLIVDPDVSALTKPVDDCDYYYSNDKVYLGSAEQSFIQLHKEQKLKAGKYVAITPCLRDEEYIDATHFFVFLKIELINVGESYYLDLIDHFISFASDYLEREEQLEVIKTEEGTDVLINGIEVGSFGTRNFLDGTPYSYGTGLAEPRFSYALSRK